jgi:hypothetical protein
MRINYLYKKLVLCIVVVTAAFVYAPHPAEARVAGPCSNCHTMHNSQNGNEEVIVDPNGTEQVGWDGSGNLVAVGSPTVTTPQESLLKTDCIGCHSTTTSNTIIEMGGIGTGYDVPIVWNINNNHLQADELAGGNFSHVAADQTKGHNVLGISGVDGNLPRAPGWSSGLGCAGSCHISLAITVTGIPESGASDNGCQACHLHTGHHYSPGDVAPSGQQPGDAYRFLGGHNDPSGNLFDRVDNALGAYESVDWGLTEPNVYQGQDSGTTYNYLNPDELTVGRFCAGCHNKFHAPGGVDVMLGTDNGGGREINVDGGWLRHPTNVSIDDTVNPAPREFDGLLGTAYDNQPYSPTHLPLARILFPNKTDLIKSTDQVFCLSCHKAHGSIYPDALRFDPSNMTSHVGGPNRTDGCFYCHRAKDD